MLKLKDFTHGLAYGQMMGRSRCKAKVASPPLTGAQMNNEALLASLPPLPLGAVYTRAIGNVGVSMHTYTADQVRECQMLAVKEASALLEKQADELERLRGIVPAVLEKLNDDLCSENERLRKDAERYRWLRENPQWLGWDSDFRPDEVEREIDAAMATKEIA